MNWKRSWCLRPFAEPTGLRRSALPPLSSKTLDSRETMMDWPTLLQTLLAVATGAALALGSSYLLERRREATARNIELRTAYSRWLAAHSTLTLHLELLSQLTDTLPVENEAFLELINAHLDEARPDLRLLAELGYIIQFLERTEALRRAVASTSDTAVQSFVFASSFVHAHRSHTRLRIAISELEIALAEVPSGHPEQSALASRLTSLREDSALHIEGLLLSSHQNLTDLVAVNGRLIRQAQDVVQELAIHD